MTRVIDVTIDINEKRPVPLPGTLLWVHPAARSISEATLIRVRVHKKVPMLAGDIGLLRASGLARFREIRGEGQRVPVEVYSAIVERKLRPAELYTNLWTPDLGRFRRELSTLSRSGIPWCIGLTFDPTAFRTTTRSIPKLHDSGVVDWWGVYSRLLGECRIWDGRVEFFGDQLADPKGTGTMILQWLLTADATQRVSSTNTVIRSFYDEGHGRKNRTGRAAHVRNAPKAAHNGRCVRVPAS